MSIGKVGCFGVGNLLVALGRDIENLL